jgi:hypothetical protein
MLRMRDRLLDWVEAGQNGFRLFHPVVGTSPLNVMNGQQLILAGANSRHPRSAEADSLPCRWHGGSFTLRGASWRNMCAVRGLRAK